MCPFCRSKRAWRRDTFRSVRRIVLPSWRPMVISSRTNGTTVFRPSSSSMISFNTAANGSSTTLGEKPKPSPHNHGPFAGSTPRPAVQSIGRVAGQNVQSSCWLGPSAPGPLSWPGDGQPLTLRTDAGDEHLDLTEFEARVRRGEVSPQSLVRLPAVTGDTLRAGVRAGAVPARSTSRRRALLRAGLLASPASPGITSAHHPPQPGGVPLHRRATGRWTSTTWCASAARWRRW